MTSSSDLFGNSQLICFQWSTQAGFIIKWTSVFDVLKKMAHTLSKGSAGVADISNSKIPRSFKTILVIFIFILRIFVKVKSSFTISFIKLVTWNLSTDEVLPLTGIRYLCMLSLSHSLSTIYTQHCVFLRLLSERPQQSAVTIKFLLCDEIPRKIDNTLLFPCLKKTNGRCQTFSQTLRQNQTFLYFFQVWTVLSQTPHFFLLLLLFFKLPFFYVWKRLISHHTPFSFLFFFKSDF